MDHTADPDEWKRAWHHHWSKNPHHWEFWLDYDGTPDEFENPRPMPETYAMEMVADWMGAGRAYTGTWDARDWYAKNREQIKLHGETRGLVEWLLEAVAP